jgi:ribosomal 30S subunit maturation factor RimM
MWASPSNIPTNISFTSLGIVIKALSVEDKRLIPFVERAAKKIKLTNKRIVVYKSY